MRLLGAPISLHDVRDVEVFTRSIIDRRLKSWSARLSPSEHDALLSFLITTAWELSGLQGDGHTQRRVWHVTVEHAEDRPALPVRLDGVLTWLDQEPELVREQRGPFTTSAAAQAAVQDGETLVLIREAPPAGAFNPQLNTSFSKYAFNILGLRVVDWYRARFHDARYGGPRDEISLDQIAVELNCSVDELVEAGPDTDLEEAMLRVAILHR